MFILAYDKHENSVAQARYN